MVADIPLKGLGFRVATAPVSPKLHSCLKLAQSFSMMVSVLMLRGSDGGKKDTSILNHRSAMTQVLGTLADSNQLMLQVLQRVML